MSSAYIAIYSALIIIFVNIIIQINNARTQSIIKRKIKNRGKIRMNEIINAYLGKDCVIYLSNSSSVITGNLISLNDNWITVKTKDGNEIINIDYIIRLKEHPVTKSGKKKSVIF